MTIRRTRSSRRSGRAGSPSQPMDRTGVRSRPTPPTRRSPCRCSTSAAGTTSCSAPPWRTTAASGTAAASGLAARSRLIIGPWSHLDLSGSFPDREFGPTASRQAIDLDGLQLRWFDRWVKGIENGIEDEEPVRIFVMGADPWRDEHDWPLPDTRLHRLLPAQRRPRQHPRRRRHPDDRRRPTTSRRTPSSTTRTDPVPTLGGQVLTARREQHRPARPARR